MHHTECALEFDQQPPCSGRLRNLDFAINIQANLWRLIASVEGILDEVLGGATLIVRSDRVPRDFGSRRFRYLGILVKQRWSYVSVPVNS
jgi:hypothetical protein